MIYFNNTSAFTKVYLGNNEFTKVYSADALVWSKTTPPTPTAAKFSATYAGGATYSAECDGSSELTTATTKPSGYVASAMTSAVIGDCVTSIGGDAFYMCFELTGITIPSGVTSIGMYAFGSCGSLTGVTCLATTPPALEYGAFNGTNDCPIYVPCNSVDAYKAANRWDSYSSRIEAIPNSCAYDGKVRITYYGGSTYEVPADGNTTLTQAEVTGGSMDKLYIVSAEIGTAVTTIGNSAFLQCYNLSSVTIPDSVTTIETRSFDHCSGLTSVVIPDSVTSIGGFAFDNCTGLTSVTIGNSVTSIGVQAFNMCTSLTGITLPDTLTSIGSTAFMMCSGLTSITIPSGVTSLDQSTFAYCSGLTTVTLPDTMTSIGYHSFYMCSGIVSVSMGSGVTTIGDSAFNYCTSLTSVTIPSSITKIEVAAFRYCESLTSITVNALQPPTLGGSVFNDTNNAPIYVPFISVNTYKSATRWNEYSSRIRAQQ